MFRAKQTLSAPQWQHRIRQGGQRRHEAALHPAPLLCDLVPSASRSPVTSCNSSMPSPIKPHHPPKTPNIHSISAPLTRSAMSMMRAGD